MNSHDAAVRRLTSLFYTLRRRGFELGIGELLDAIRALELGWAHDEPGLKKLASLLFCHSPEEQYQLELLSMETARPRTGPAEGPGQPQAEAQPTPDPPVQPSPTAGTQGELTPIPVKTPPAPALPFGERPQTYWPITQRAMAYGWRRLRRPVADGPADVLDLDATVSRAVHDGFFLQPAYTRRVRNHARLTLLLDMNGSMAPFHSFCRDLAATATAEPTLEEVAVFYFHNLPEAFYLDRYLTRPAGPLLPAIEPDTSILVVSDAGAARGHHRSQRVRATNEFVTACRRHTPLMAWLNPLPRERWNGNSASAISQFVPMRQLDDEGFRHAVDLLRGYGK
ncbi:MAG: hypothetical protein SFV51_30195 [Bryobacteraceae bacterium]|nr:hypothetical protein [Bryobacteraceae bacterium]